MIVIIDYKLGNLGSIQNMLRKIGYASLISSRPEDINNASRLILPGVGAFDSGMTNLRQTGLIPLLEEKVFKDMIPILGICLGMQLLTRCSEEGEAKESGLAWIQADTKRFRLDPDSKLRIPHMGWNFVNFLENSPLSYQMPDDSKFYFVHSYHPICDDARNQFMTTTYGYEFASGICSNNIYGVQFHPEKSHRYGMQLLKNFIECVPTPCIG